jgi:hypothetical protein
MASKCIYGTIPLGIVVDEDKSKREITINYSGPNHTGEIILKQDAVDAILNEYRPIIISENSAQPAGTRSR